jgi:hypothetical protein
MLGLFGWWRNSPFMGSRNSQKLNFEPDDSNSWFHTVSLKMSFNIIYASEYPLDCGLNNQGIGVWFPAVAEIFLFMSRLALGPTQCPIQGGEADYSFPCSGEDKNAWNHTVSGVVFKYKDDFTLCTYFQLVYSHVLFVSVFRLLWKDMACRAVWLLSFFFCLSHFTSCVNTAWCWGNQICYAVCYISFTLTLCCQGLLCDLYLTGVPVMLNHSRYMSRCLGKRENKVVPVHICHSKNMYGGNVGIARHILNLGTRWKCWFLCLSLRKALLILNGGAGWATEPVWILWRRENSLSLAENWTPIP